MDFKAQLDLAEDLVAKGVITADQLAVAKVSQKNYGSDLTEILIKRGYVSKDLINQALTKRTNLAVVSLDAYAPSKELLSAVPIDIIKKYRLVPFSLSGEELVLALSGVIENNGLEEIKRAVKYTCFFVLALPGDLEICLKRHFGVVESSVDVAPQPKPSGNNQGYNWEEGGKRLHIIDKAGIKEGQTDVNSADAVMLVNKIIFLSVNDRASDLHIEPTRKHVRVRIRVDGRLTTLMELPVSAHQKVLSRIKIMSHLDVAENRRTQDGSATVVIDSLEVDLRIATYPTLHGEAAAIRISVHSGLITIADLGMSARDQQVFEALVKRPDGILLVTGPTGSGKTTTIYAALEKIDRETKHVLTAEDPIEREIDGVVQTQVNSKAGITFPVILRSMLREDPDVILVGEIRDKETAEISLRAAMTGHLVLSTLHTNTAIGAIARLIDLGLESYLVASTLAGVLAQRLVRKICPDCKVESPLSELSAKALGHKALNLIAFKGRGCTACKGVGFRGRIGIYEVVPIDDEFRILVNNKAPEIRMQEKAIALGCKTMLDDGLEKIRDGLTTPEEVLNVCWRP